LSDKTEKLTKLWPASLLATQENNTNLLETTTSDLDEKNRTNNWRSGRGEITLPPRSGRGSTSVNRGRRRAGYLPDLL
jgi:hypothetical protein